MQTQIIGMAVSGMLLMSLNSINAKEFVSEVKHNNSKEGKVTVVKGSGDEGVKGKIMVNAGVGLNGTRALLLLQYNGYDGSPSVPIINSSSQLPLINVGVDYGFARRFSFGAAFGYQSIKLNANAASNGIAGTDTWTRFHLAGRADYYIVANENLNLYTGLKIGYNMYKVKSTYTSIDPSYISDLKTYVSGPLKTGVQAHFGFSYFFNGMIGVNTEVGIAVGGPYYFAAGLGFKF